MFIKSWNEANHRLRVFRFRLSIETVSPPFFNPSPFLWNYAIFSPFQSRRETRKVATGEKRKKFLFFSFLAKERFSPGASLCTCASPINSRVGVCTYSRGYLPSSFESLERKASIFDYRRRSVLESREQSRSKEDSERESAVWVMPLQRERERKKESPNSWVFLPLPMDRVSFFLFLSLFHWTRGETEKRTKPKERKSEMMMMAARKSHLLRVESISSRYY